MKIKYYIVHGIDSSRKERMICEFEKANIPIDNVLWMLKPNRDDITDKLKNEVTKPNANANILTNSLISCTYKHYLIMKDIVENQYDYAVIFEDNIFFTLNDADSRIKLYIEQLNSFYPDWDILYDSNYRDYTEQSLIPGIFVYPKDATVDGGTRVAQCYLITQKCAKKYLDNYLPFDNAPDHWMNYLNKTLNINVFWSQPPMTNTFPHKSTVLD
jgi:GR25 family glycosyltransferase involved in LPS biosynthesis